MFLTTTWPPYWFLEMDIRVRRVLIDKILIFNEYHDEDDTESRKQFLIGNRNIIDIITWWVIYIKHILCSSDMSNFLTEFIIWSAFTVYPTAQILSLNLWVQCFCLHIQYTFWVVWKPWKYLSLCATIMISILSEYHYTDIYIPLLLDLYPAMFLHIFICILSLCSCYEAIIVCVHRE